jgi:hypothetical protein
VGAAGIQSPLRGAALFGILAMGMAFGLASCGSTPTRSMPCPEVKIIPDASYMTRFAGDSEDLTDTAYEAKIAIANQVCHYVVNSDTKKTTIRTDLTVQVMASRGPKLTGDKADIGYRVSVTGPGGSHVGDPKWTNSFTVTVPLTADRPTAGIADMPSVQIPIANQDENGDFYRIYVYLVLTEKELAYNRRNPQQ